VRSQGVADLRGEVGSGKWGSGEVGKWGSGEISTKTLKP